MKSICQTLLFSTTRYQAKENIVLKLVSQSGTIFFISSKSRTRSKLCCAGFYSVCFFSLAWFRNFQTSYCLFSTRFLHHLLIHILCKSKPLQRSNRVNDESTGTLIFDKVKAMSTSRFMQSFYIVCYFEKKYRQCLVPKESKSIDIREGMLNKVKHFISDNIHYSSCLRHRSKLWILWREGSQVWWRGH